MKKLLCAFLLLVSALAHSTLAGAASVTLGQAGPGGVSAIITPDPGEIGRPANIWIGAVWNGTLYVRDGPTTWVEYRGGLFPIALTSAALPSSLQVSIVNFDISSLQRLDVYVGYGSTEADLSLSGHLAKVYPPVPTPVATAVGVPTGSATSATIGAAGGSVSMPDGKIALTIPAGALASDTVISIQPLTNLAHGKIGAAYRLTPEGQTFLTPITLTFSYTDDDLLGTAAEVLGVAFQTADGYWQWAGDATIDTTAKTVSIVSSHFSGWSLVTGAQIYPASKTVKVNRSVDLEVVHCYPPIPVSFDPRGYPCKPYTYGAFTREWSVNGLIGGRSGGVFGTVSGNSLDGNLNGATATYTAPATKPFPPPLNTVFVSALLEAEWGTIRSRVRATSKITIEDCEGGLSPAFKPGNALFAPQAGEVCVDSWSGTGSSTFTWGGVTSSATAQVTWTLESRINNVVTYLPTGTVSVVLPRITGLGCSYNPSTVTINPSTDGVLIVDYNANPPTYSGRGYSVWVVAVTCPLGSESAVVGGPFFGGSKGLDGFEAQGLVSPDGVTIEGSDISLDGTTFNWKFTRD